MKTKGIIALAVLALSATAASAQNFQGDGYPGHRYRAFQSRDVALPYGPSASEQQYFDRASRSFGGGGY